jgi:hypothetical protein
VPPTASPPSPSACLAPANTHCCASASSARAAISSTIICQKHSNELCYLLQGLRRRRACRPEATSACMVHTRISSPAADRVHTCSLRPTLFCRCSSRPRRSLCVVAAQVGLHASQPSPHGAHGCVPTLHAARRKGRPAPAAAPAPSPRQRSPLRSTALRQDSTRQVTGSSHHHARRPSTTMRARPAPAGLRWRP